ncbi:MAG: hypothetical protein ACOYN1_09310 [Polynucleobacter sp.]
MNNSLIEVLPNWLIFVIFPILSWVILAFITLLFRKFSQIWKLEDSDSGVIDTATQNAMSGAYVVLGFVLVLVMATANEVDSNTAKEASQIESLDRMLMMDGSPTSLLARQSLRAYAKSIVSDEWKHLSEGMGSEKTGNLAKELFQNIEGIQPSSSRQLALFPEIIKKNDEISQSRNLRILSSQSRLPSLFWEVSFLTLLGVIVIAAIRLVHPTTTRIIVLGVQIGMVSLLFTAVMILDLPYLGQTKTSPDVFLKAIQIIELRK